MIHYSFHRVPVIVESMQRQSILRRAEVSCGEITSCKVGRKSKSMTSQAKRKSARTKNPMFIEGTHNAEVTSSAPIHVEIPYVSLGREGAPRVWVPTNHRYMIPLPKIPTEVTVEGSMLGRILELRFVDHDFITNYNPRNVS